MPTTAEARKTTPQPKRWKKGGPFVLYSGEGRAVVIMQDGCLFNEQHEDLFYQFATDPDRVNEYRNNILIWLDHNGYAVNGELRSNLVRTLKEQQLQAKMEEERRKAREREAEELAEMEAQLAKHRKANTPRGPVPPALTAATRPHEDLVLTEMEEEVLGGMFATEDDDTGLPPLAQDDDDEVAPPEDDPVPPARVVASKRKR